MNSFAWSINEDFVGISHETDTFDNPILTGSKKKHLPLHNSHSHSSSSSSSSNSEGKEFLCEAVEVWGFATAENMELLKMSPSAAKYRDSKGITLKATSTASSSSSAVTAGEIHESESDDDDYPSCSGGSDSASGGKGKKKIKSILDNTQYNYVLDMLKDDGYRKAMESR